MNNGWHIERNPKPIPDRRYDYDFWHDNHDGDNGLCGSAQSIEDAERQIAEIESGEPGTWWVKVYGKKATED